MKNYSRKTRILNTFFMLVVMGLAFKASGKSYYIDSKMGNDANNGLSPKEAWKTLEKASNITYAPGDYILLKRRAVFVGKLELNGARGSKKAPVVVEAYGSGKQLPKINSQGYLAGVTIQDGEFVIVRDLEISSDGGKAIDAKAKIKRFGIHVINSNNVSLKNLYIHTVFATTQTKSEGKDKTTAYGQGLCIDNSNRITVDKCLIEKVGHFGICAIRSSNINIINNKTDHTGCSGVQMGRSKDIVIRGNTFDHPGSYIDERMHGRGSGSWMWSCDNVLYENNKFLNARGKGDSCGVHIDFNCSNVLIQRCFSMNNEGGFIEILGNDHNCCYRYNISVNDGFRVKGKNGAFQEGKTLFLCGYVGSKPRSGPFNSYIYNNTIYVREGARSCFSISPSTRGVFIANNIFHILSPTVDVKGDQKKYMKKGKNKIPGVVFKNNIYIHDSVIPKSLVIQDSNPIIGDVGFKNPGGDKPEDYIPTSEELVKDRGIKITKIPGDKTGLKHGLEVKEDFFGNPIKGAADIGAVEISE